MCLTSISQVPVLHKFIVDKLNSEDLGEGTYRIPGNEKRIRLAVKQCKATGYSSLPQVVKNEKGEWTELTLVDVACLHKRFFRDLPVGLLYDITPVLLDLHGPRKDGSTLSEEQKVLGHNAALRLLPSERHLDLTLHLFSW